MREQLLRVGCSIYVRPRDVETPVVRSRALLHLS
jgi:hypothetical protein